MEEKTFVDDINRSVYDIKNEENDSYRIKQGLTPEIVEKISEEKHDPAWMREFRLKSLEIYNNMQVPDWGPSIDGLNMDNIATYVRANTNMKGDWKDVPEEIKDTFDRLGIPKAERESLAGVGAQYDSELVYHNVRKEVADQGVVYTDMESALTGEYADMVHEHFMKLITPQDHKFAALHGAVWSGGSFVYVPKGVNLEIPLQSYFRLNAAEQVSLSIHLLLLMRVQVFTLLKDVQHLNIMLPIFMQVRLSFLWLRMQSFVTQQLRTGARICIILTLREQLLLKVVRLNGFQAHLVRMYHICIL